MKLIESVPGDLPMMFLVEIADSSSAIDSLAILPYG